MTPFAGPVFPEWYWGPIFFALVYGPGLLAVAFVVDLVARRRLEGSRRAALAAGVVLGGTLLILGGQALIEDVRFEREATAVARGFDFTPYRPAPLPRPFTEERVTADDNWTGPALISHYGAGPGAYATAFQQRPIGEVSLQDGHCSLTKLAGSGTNFFDGPCRALGSGVFLGASETIVDGNDAFALLDGTLVRLAGIAGRPTAMCSPTSTRCGRSTRPTSSSSAADTNARMDFDLSDDHELIRRTVRDFAEGEVAPVAEALDREKRFPYEIVAKLGELGLMGIPFPEEYGGAGGDTLAYAIAVEELTRVDSSRGDHDVRAHVAGHAADLPVRHRRSRSRSGCRS